MIYFNHLAQIALFFLLHCTTLTLARPDATTTTTDHFVSPTINAVVSVGVAFPIEWIITTESDPSSDGEDYNLTLFVDGRKVRVLDGETNSTAGDNTFVWVPGTSLVDSTEYHVRAIYPNLTLTSPKFAVTGGRQDSTTTTSTTSSSSSSSTSSTTTTTGSSATSNSTPNTYTPAKTRRRSHTGAIVGGIVGGLLGLAILAGLIWFFCSSKRRKDEVVKDGDGVTDHETTGGGMNEAYAPQLHAESKGAVSELPENERPIGELSGIRERAELAGSGGGEVSRSELA